MLGRMAMVVGVWMCITTSARPARAQVPDSAQRSDTTLRVQGLKDPQLAEALGIFPGGGLFYAGDWKQGLRGYFGTVSAIGAGGMTIALGELQGCAPLDINCRPRGSVWPTRIVGGALVASGIVFWGYEAVNAGGVVRRNNARKIAAAHDTVRGRPRSDVHAFVTPVTTGRALALGVHATW
jgi:hypothetical protein